MYVNSSKNKRVFDDVFIVWCFVFCRDLFGVDFFKKDVVFFLLMMYYF